MTVYLYQGGLRLVAKSGIGQAAAHQAAMLQSAGVTVAQGWQPPADVIHLNTVFPASLLAAGRARRRGAGVVWYGHSTPQDVRRSFIGSDALAPLLARWLRFCYNHADVVITPTPYAAARLRELGVQRPLYALSNGVDTAFFAPDAARGAAFRRRYGLAAGAPVIVSAGHFMRRKGILDFIALAAAMPQARFFWFGHTPPALVPRAVRRAMAAAPQNLTFAGFVPQSELRDAYCGADVFLFCSEEETEGIVVLEALACGTPTVVRDIPVYAGWLADGREVRKARDLPGFAAAVRGLLADRALREGLSRAARQTALTRALPAVGRRLCGIYRQAGLWRA